MAKQHNTLIASTEQSPGLTKYLNVQSLLWLALALALLGSLKHLASVFASVDGARAMGWVQAVAIDTGLFALAYKIKVRRSGGQSIKLLSVAVSLFTAISIYGNLTYGLAALGPLPEPIRVTRPYVLAATLPVLVLILSHLLSDDRQHANELAHKGVSVQPSFGTDTIPDTLTLTNDTIPNNVTPAGPVSDTKQDQKAERLNRALELLQAGMSQPAVASELGLSLSTVKRYAKELNGRTRGEL